MPVTPRISPAGQRPGPGISIDALHPARIAWLHQVVSKSAKVLEDLRRKTQFQIRSRVGRNWRPPTAAVDHHARRRDGLLHFHAIAKNLRDHLPHGLRDRIPSCRADGHQ